MTILCCLPVFTEDVPKLQNLLKWLHQLSGCHHHSAVIVADAATSAAHVLGLQIEAAKSFETVQVISTAAPVNGWPAGPNSLWLAAALYAKEQNCPWLFLEPDAVPLGPSWLDAIDIHYRARGRAYMGALVSCSDPRLPPLHLAGVAVYPAWAHEELAQTVCDNPGKAFDLAVADKVVPQAIHSDLFQHLWGEIGNPPTFAERRIPKTNTFDLAYLKPKSVLFHRSKDGTLIKLLRQQYKMPTGAIFVSLRRAGDIISLLPALHRIALRDGTNPNLVVHRDFMPILDGVTYINGIPWAEDWENPLEAAKQHKAVNAQVFGKGIKTNTASGNFVYDAWGLIGERWNRHRPLVFDNRNLDREEALAQRVFLNSKPKILLKLSGNSSPFAGADFVRQSVYRLFGDMAEIVNLDEVVGERIYDLLGLMDRAACLVSIDTVTLHLAHASKCPVIAFTNGNGFGATPPRGNCILRIPYTAVQARWQEVNKLVTATLAPKFTNDNIVLVYSDFVPKDPEIAKRNALAASTWCWLKARHLAFKAIRTSKSIGDTKNVPFVRDMIEKAFQTGSEGIAVLTNNDIAFDRRLQGAIVDACKKYGCYWAYRTERYGGPTDNGADVFAMTRHWWKVHQHLLPDFLLGYWHWDSTLNRIMIWSGCHEQARLYYHVPHVSTDSTQRTKDKGTKHNEDLAWKWLAQHWEEFEKSNLY